MGWVVNGFEAGRVFVVKMVDFDMFGFVDFDCNKTIFFDGRGKNAISFVVDVLSDDIDSAGGSCDEIGFGAKSLSKFLDQG